MRHVFWLLPGLLAGRPGPNREPWDLMAFRSLGFGAVLTLNDGEGFARHELDAVGLVHGLVPLPPNEPPQAGDEELCRAALPVAYDFVIAQHAARRAVLAHCSAGKDRTGLFLSYYLMRAQGLDLEASIVRVRTVQPRALSALGWESLARRVLAELRDPGGVNRRL